MHLTFFAIKLVLMFVFFTLLQVRVNHLSAQSNTIPDSIIVINGIDPLEFLGEKTYYLEDEEGNLTMDDIMKPEKQALFKKNDKPVFVRSPSSKTYWLKLVILNQSEEDLYIEIRTHVMWYLDYYEADQDGYRQLAETGMMRPEENRPYPINFYWMKLKKKPTTQTVYFRLKNESIFEVPIQIGTLSQLSLNKSYGDSIFYGFVGLVMIMIGYNFFLYLSIKDTIYVIYSVYLVMILFVVTNLNNHPFYAYVFGDGTRIYAARYFLVWYAPLPVFAWLFAVRFLNLKVLMPSTYYLSMGTVAVISIFLPISNIFKILPNHINAIIYQTSFSVLSLIILISGLYLWVLKKESQAMFYTIAWAWAILSAFVLVFTFNGIIPYHYLTRNATFFGTGLEILFFSLALGDRFNKMRKENLRIVENQKEELEILVVERTSQLKDANEEILQANEELQQANEEIMTNSEALEDRNKEITDSINYAKRIQQAILPLHEEMAAYLQEYFVLFKPRDIVSGDFYYFQCIQNKIIIAALDCTGHGVPGAFMSMLGKEILDNILIEKAVAGADNILNELHKGIRKALKQDQSNNKDGMDMCLIVIDKETKSLEFAGAKNSLVYIADGELHEIKGNKTPIGGEQRELERLFTKHIVHFSSNTIFYLFTDGYQDQFGGKERKKFMLSRMKDALKNIHSLPMEEQKAILDQQIKDWMTEGREKQIDDILVMGIKI